MKKPYAFGVDVGGTTIKIGLFRTGGELVEKWEIPTNIQNCGESILPDIVQALLDKLKQLGAPISDVEGVGLGVPGAVLNGSYVKPCVNLGKWGGFNAAEAFTALSGMPAKLVNDANAAALGEMRAGGGRGCKNVVFVTLGTGVGGGIIVDGKLLAGVHGAGGEIGHIKVSDEETTPCGCGKFGCVEQYASATGIVNRAKQLLAKGDAKTALGDIAPLTCKDIFDCARVGDPAALGLVDEMAQLLGKMLAAVSCVCDPEVIVLGGGVSRAGDILVERVKEHFTAFAFPAAEDTRFALAELGNDAGIYGCMQLIVG